MADYKAITLTIHDQVAVITLRPVTEGLRQPGGNIHWELATAFSDLRGDDSIRVIVLTGEGEQFLVPAPSDTYSSGDMTKRLTDPPEAWRTFSGITRCHQAMAEIEKPIVAKVNGDAIGFGQSLVFACDIIIARADAKLMDHHMAGVFSANYAGEVKQGGHEEFCSVPGDGGLALLPLYMSPCRAKEYLMLARPYTATELADLGIINYAVPRDQLDRKVDEIVQALLRRSPYALAWTKRVANRRLAEHLNLTLDAGVAYEMVSFYQLDRLDPSKKERRFG